MGSRLPPSVVFIIHFGLVWISGRYLTFANLTFPGQELITLVLSITGIVIAVTAIIAMRRAGTTVDPIDPTKASSLVVSGIYRISRNPIYLALLLILMAWIIRQGNLVAVFLAVTFVWQLTHFQIRAEEQALEEKFREKYSEYRLEVRRWI